MKKLLTTMAALLLFTFVSVQGAHAQGPFTTAGTWTFFVKINGAPPCQCIQLGNLKSDGTGPNVFLGDEQFRHYNHIDTKTSNAFLAGTWTLGDHSIKGGFDYLNNQIYNLFGRGEFGLDVGPDAML